MSFRWDCDHRVAPRSRPAARDSAVEPGQWGQGMQDVVVTGLGVASSLGSTVDEFELEHAQPRLARPARCAAAVLRRTIDRPVPGTRPRWALVGVRS
jgi:hypothetical protein